MAFGMLAAKTIVKLVARLLECSRVTVHTSLVGTTSQEAIFTHLVKGDQGYDAETADSLINLTQLRQRFQVATVTAK